MIFHEETGEAYKLLFGMIQNDESYRKGAYIFDIPYGRGAIESLYRLFVYNQISQVQLLLDEYKCVGILI